MALKRGRNIETEKYVARNQAAVMGGIDPEDLIKLIDAKGGDYYRGDLLSTPELQEAYKNLGMTQSNSPMFALQAQILDEMRGYYGLNQPVRQAVASPEPKPKPNRPQRTIGKLPLNMRHEEYTDGSVINVGPEQGPKQAEAQQLKEEYINKIVGYDVQKRYEDILKPKGFFMDDPLLEAALLGGAALGTGAVGAAAISGDDEEERIKWAIENGYTLN